jgi:hypothetical protein
MSGGKHFNCMRVARTLQERTAKSRGTVPSGIGIGTDDRLPSFAGKSRGPEGNVWATNVHSREAYILAASIRGEGNAPFRGAAGSARRISLAKIDIMQAQ